MLWLFIAYLILVAVILLAGKNAHERSFVCVICGYQAPKKIFHQHIMDSTLYNVHKRRYILSSLECAPCICGGEVIRKNGQAYCTNCGFVYVEK